MYRNQCQNAPKDLLPNGSNNQHEPFIYQQAHEEIKHKVHQQAELIPKPYKEIEDQAGRD